VLLVGDGTYDARLYPGNSAPTYIPPYLAGVDPIYGETATDNRYASVSGDDTVPDLHAGRLPPNSASEAEVMVNGLRHICSSATRHCACRSWNPRGESVTLLALRRHQ
jgi:hypothetical protein